MCCLNDSRSPETAASETETSGIVVFASPLFESDEPPHPMEIMRQIIDKGFIRNDDLEVI